MEEDKSDPSEEDDWEEDKFDPNETYDWEEDKFDPNETYDWEEDKFDPNENYDWDAENNSDDDNFDDNNRNDNNFEANYNRDGSETILSPPEEESRDKPIEESEHDPDPEHVPEWADKDDLAGDNIPEIDVPEGTFEPREDMEQEPIEEPEQEPDPELVPEWADKNDLAGHNTPEIDTPEGTFEPHEGKDGEPIEEPDPELVPEWADKDDLTGENTPEIDVPEGTFEPREDMKQEPIEEPDPELVPEWADKGDLAGDKLPEIDVPEGTFEPISEGDQRSIQSSDQKSDQVRNNDIIRGFSNDSSPKSIQANNDVLILADNYSSSTHNEKKSSEGLSRKKKKQDQRKERESHSYRRMSDKSTSNKQKSSQSTVLILKSETQSHNKEKEEKKETEKEESKKDDNKKKNHEEKKEINTSTKEGQKEIPEIQRESEKDVPDEVIERYQNETGRRPYYNEKKTKGFEEWLKNNAKSEKEERVKKENDQKKESKEDWQSLLERWLNDIDEIENPKEIIKELIKLFRKYRQIEDLEKRLINLIEKENLSDKEIAEIRELIKKLNDLNLIEKKIFESISAFKNFYNNKITWFEHEIKAEENKFPRYLIEKLINLKEQTKESEKIENFQSSRQNWKEFLNKKIESIDDLNDNEKEIIKQILRNSNLTEQEINKLSAILSKLDTDTLIEILGDSFKKHTKKYVKWGWDFYDYIRKNMLNSFLLMRSKDKSQGFNENEISFENKDPISVYGKIFKFPKDLRLKISEYIYSIIQNEDLNNEKNDSGFGNVLRKVVKILSKNEIYKRFPTYKEGFDKFLENYIRDLIIIVNEFKNRGRSSDPKPINISQLANQLLVQGNNLNNKRSQLRANLRSIFLHLKQNIKDFNLEKLNKKNLERDEEGKVCSRCGSKKPYKDFFKRENELVKHVCKSCYIEITEISKFRKKYRLLQEIKNGVYGGNCANPDCKINFKWLPAMEFHHLGEKSAAWRKLLKRKYETIKKILDYEDRTKPLCSNCHNLATKVFYNKYKEIIEDISIFINSKGVLYPTDNIIKNLKERLSKIKLFEGYTFSETKYEVLGWIKKRLVIEQLYYGKCAICGETNIAKLQFHHLDQILKNTYKHKNSNLDGLSIWKTLVLSTITETIERLIFEECACVCSNCHSMIESKYFEDNAADILSEKYYLEEDGLIREHQLDGEKYVEDIQEIFKKIRKVLEKEHDRINKIKFNKNFRITDPLIKFEIWEKILLDVHHLTETKYKNEFTVKELQNLTVYSVHKVKRWLRYLENNDLISIDRIGYRNARIYKLNNNGKDTVKKIIKKYKKYYNAGYNEYLKKFKNIN